MKLTTSHPLLLLLPLAGMIPLVVFADETPAASTVAAAMGFEDQAAWVTAPFEFVAGPRADFKAVEKEKRFFDWTVPAQNPDDLVHGAKLSMRFAKEGKYSLEWKDHGQYPTIACRTIEHDWKAYSGIAVWMNSSVATGETIVLGVLSDSPATPGPDYMTCRITVNWTGWKEVRIPFPDFTRNIGAPVGWQKIEAICFFAKSEGQDPDPRTVLFLDDFRLLTGNLPTAQDRLSAGGKPSRNPSDPWNLNHDLPEVTRQLTNDEPEIQTCYFNAARGRYGYYPRYEPGYVSFSPDGIAHLRNQAAIETLGAEGKWVRLDLQRTLADYAQKAGWQGFKIVGMPNEPMIRFDAQGDLYAIENVNQLDAAGKLKDKKALLLHRSKGKQNWTVYPLPLPMADFEKLDGNNADCLKHPPALVLGAFRFFGNHDANLYLLLPEKQDDGTLRFPPKIPIAKDGLMGPVHSGSGNFIVSQGEKIYAVYGVVPSGGDAEKKKAWAINHPLIPPDHPARAMTTSHRAGTWPPDKGPPASGGVPTYVVEYDRKTQKLSEPVFVGYGGIAADGHNWAAMAIDSKGMLHVVISGHVDPLLYTHTLVPGDITRWSPPEYVPFKPGSQELAVVSYASLNCDKQDNLLCVVRSDSYVYNHRLASLRKPAGKPWENERPIVIPFADGYHVWTHKVTYDRLRDRFFLSFFDQSERIELSRDAFFFYRHIWPAREKALVNEAGRSAVPKAGGKGLFVPGPQEMTVLISENRGFSWRFATTSDFMKGMP